MAFSLVNLFTGITTPVTQQVSQSIGNNPFTNDIIKNNEKYLYAKNHPVPGGYFVGYYNGKPNIVGRKLFIEV